MDQVRLTFLVVCALLTTTLGPFGISDATGPASDSHSVVSAVVSADLLPAVSSARTDSNETGLAATNTASDEAMATLILERLAMRHTALPERERVALVDTILREARVHDLDPALVVAVIEVESAGYHLAVSRVGAMGLMQLLPSTAEELAARMDIEWKGPDMLFDPNINVRLGTAYLSQLAKRYGNVDTALAAYNWGPGRIDRRLRRGATVPSRYIDQVMQAFDRNAITLVSRS